MQKEFEQKEINQTINFHCGCGGGSGETPFIGENGNWWIGDEDTGVSAQGPMGDRGEIGPAGPQGIKGDPGIQGSKGDTGSIGPQGPQGIKGKDADESKVDQLRIDVDQLDSNLRWYVDNGFLPSFSNLTYLYYTGNEYTELTGGWESYRGTTLNKSNSSMFSYVSTDIRIAIGTVSKVKRPSGVTKLWAEVSGVTNSINSLDFSVSAEKYPISGGESQILATDSVSGNTSKYIFSIVLPEATEFYVQFTRGATSQPSVISFSIDKVWFE